MKLSRRQFLFGAATLAALSAAAALIPQIGTYPPNELDLRYLSDREAHIYRILGEWLLPPGGSLPGSGGDDETIVRIDAMFADLPQAQRIRLFGLPLLFEHGTGLDRFAARRMTSLSPEAREAYLRGWAESDNLIKIQLLAAIRTMYAFSYFERPDVLYAMGLSPHCRISS
ncbi:MAG: hypothetical protein VX278_03155 [Myxococcota bacterium]|nr:hypothetical protein [Myxococcota bacterium]